MILKTPRVFWSAGSLLALHKDKQRQRRLVVSFSATPPTLDTVLRLNQAATLIFGVTDRMSKLPKSRLRWGYSTRMKGRQHPLPKTDYAGVTKPA